MKRKHSGIKAGIVVILCILLLTIVGVVISNQFNARYENLNKTDQFVLEELNEYCKVTEKKDIWENFNLNDKTILAMDGSFGKAYLVNPASEINSIFAKEIQMPDDYGIKVYRISLFSPKLLQFRFDGNFNTLEKNYSVFGNSVYYIKYNDTESVSPPFRSSHFITLLSHEAFHYYMQNEWADGAVYSTDELSDDNLELLYQEYEILDKIQKTFLENTSDREVLLQYAKEYADIISRRLEKAPQYVEQELERETIEGTATYIGIKASEIVGYDFGVMYFDNKKNVLFSEIKSNVEAGLYEKSNLADRIPYETGGLLCLLMDKLEIPDWQKTLNSQTKDYHITLYSVLEAYVRNIE